MTGDVVRLWSYGASPYSIGLVNLTRPRNVLIIAYEFPPSAGGGVQRIMKLARYLPDSGWQPYVLTATPAWGRPRDDALLVQTAGIPVTRLANRNVSTAIARLLSPLKRRSRGDASAGPDTQRPASADTPAASAAGPATRIPLSTRIVRRLMFDTASLWAARVPAAAVRMSREVTIDAVLASGPPHSALVAGAATARRLDVPFIADVRDPWLGSPAYRWPEDPRKDARSVSRHADVMRGAAVVLAVSDPIAAESLAAGASSAVTIANGFDPADLPAWSPQAGALRVAFMGRFYDTTDPTPFLDGVAEAVRRGGAASDLVIEIVGPPSALAGDAIAARNLESHVIQHGFRAHAEALRVVATADLGLVTLADRPGAEAIYTGKLFEYMGIGLPVLLVGPTHGVAARLLEESRTGISVAPADTAAIADTLERIASEKRSGTLAWDPDDTVVARYDRRAQAAQVARLLDEVVS